MFLHKWKLQIRPIVKIAQAALFSLGLTLFSPNSYAHANTCLAAARAASAETGVPIAILLRVKAHNKQNTHGDTTPWSVKLPGEPAVSFRNSAAAYEYVFVHFLRGSRNFRIGCFQLEFNKHARDFPNIEAMFDPENNALAAAAELSFSFKMYGSWSSSVADYFARDMNIAAHAERVEVRRTPVACRHCRSDGGLHNFSTL